MPYHLLPLLPCQAKNIDYMLNGSFFSVSKRPSAVIAGELFSLKPPPLPSHICRQPLMLAILYFRFHAAAIFDKEENVN